MRSKKEQQARLAELRKKAEATGTRHGEAIRNARITTGQAVQAAAVTSWSYVRKTAANA
jgi:hypothetical protein